MSIVVNATLVFGCSAEGQEQANEDGGIVASIDVALTTVPALAQCIRITATPSSGTATVKTFSVSSGSSSTNLQIGPLAPGAYALSADAFNVACTSIGTSVGNWIADPVQVTVRTGVAASLTMTFRKNAPITASVNFVNNVLGGALGYYSSYLTTDGGVLSSSSSGFYRTGFSAFDPSTSANNQVISVVALFSGACAARADGTVWCWGFNNAGELGPGIALYTQSLTPVQVSGIQNVRQLVAGSNHVCALATGYGVYCWGYNAQGQLGNGTTTNSATPIRIMTTEVKALAAGANSSYAIANEGYGLAWGYNSSGQLGDASTINRTQPVAITNEAPLQSISAGASHACGLRVDGTVRCWGYNGDGQLGDGTTTSRLAPTLVPGIVAQQIVSGEQSNCALTVGGQLLCWGFNALGAIGDGTNTNRLAPTPVKVSGWVPTSLLGGPYASGACAVASSQDLYCWGGNRNGSMGVGTATSQFLPAKAVIQ